MERYTAGVLGQVRDTNDGRVRTIDEMIRLRRDSLGILPCFVLLQIGLPSILPDFVVGLPLVKEVEILCTDLVIIHNDVVSYAKEESEDVVHNLIACCRLQGMSNSQAFDHLGQMLDERMDRLDYILHRLPSWGEKIDVEAAKYVQGCKDMVISNLHWSFRRERYFGRRAVGVRETRLIELLENPPYLREYRSEALILEDEAGLDIPTLHTTDPIHGFVAGPAPVLFHQSPLEDGHSLTHDVAILHTQEAASKDISHSLTEDESVQQLTKSLNVGERCCPSTRLVDFGRDVQNPDVEVGIAFADFTVELKSAV
ncbi:hypothetical protein PRZ48_008681 [Zasmidium cellare]|uniref:Terpene synthase n=1 Tax=Zasmidium cellare TaxID=395010 RepID=A0ABR0EG53_ZASCE|nr:hypothetical protein PRZ48_008681 [Zasmidium cellare]